MNELGDEKHLTDMKKEVVEKLKANKDKLSRFKVRFSSYCGCNHEPDMSL